MNKVRRVLLALFVTSVSIHGQGFVNTRFPVHPTNATEEGTFHPTEYTPEKVAMASNMITAQKQFPTTANTSKANPYSLEPEASLKQDIFPSQPVAASPANSPATSGVYFSGAAKLPEQTRAVVKDGRIVAEEAQPPTALPARAMRPHNPNVSVAAAPSNSLSQKAHKNIGVLIFCTVVSLIALGAFLREIMQGGRRHS